MITRQQLLDSLIHECNVVKHLYTKVPTDGFDYRPTPRQRSTLELMRYLAVCGIAPIKVMVAGTWGVWKPYEERVKDMLPEDFPAAMDRQIEELREQFNALSDEELATREVVYPTGEKMPMAYGILRMPLAWLTGYRMQLFLYAKAAGTHDIGTGDCWIGPPKEEEIEATTEADA